MAVEAHHLHLFPSQLLRNSSEIVSSAENQQGFYNMQMGFVSPASGAAAAASSFLPVYSSPAPVPPVAACDSGLTFNDAVAGTAVPSRKRPRAGSFLGDDVISSHLQQQMLDMDRLVMQHAEKVRAELAERRKRLTRQFLAALEDGVSKRLKARDEEIARIGKLNWALEERIKSLCLENQIWRDMAQNNEATANALRNNLEQVLSAQMRIDQAAAATADDAESCCSGDDGEDDDCEEQKAGAVTRVDWRRACRSCREREPSVLLLPCRHLCLCAACGPAVDACPICNCTKTGSFNVNLS
ncbi:putative BOI-related E3 ubiquitin-protein ligase 3 [Canna indica]|uniref:BOI-related E3 ubiquitin-protein ligase 3 n=1 Tax=Canna indica TaxID=4628 RepID=A0AAQ3Q891_9LILI|nr:putative BOI-related E3 ubiquitin-protein ligase 3 [Canna indica]